MEFIQQHLFQILSLIVGLGILTFAYLNYRGKQKSGKVAIIKGTKNSRFDQRGKGRKHIETEDGEDLNIKQ